MIFRTLILLSALPAVWALDTSPLKEFSMEPGEGGHYSMNQNSIDAEGISVRDLLAFSYGLPPAQVLGPELLNDRYHVVAKAPASDEAQFHEALREAVSAKLHLREARSTKQIQVFVLKLATPEHAKSHEGTGPISMSGTNDTLSAKNVPMVQFVKFLAQKLGHPVIDETGLPGGYTAEIEWRAGDNKSLAQAFREGLGVEWVEQKREVPVILVNRQ